MEIVAEPQVLETPPAESEKDRRITELEQLLAKETARADTAEAHALKDRLTELPNREFIEITLEKELARLRRGVGKLAVAIFDLDRFKEINDSEGHPQGDRVLRAVARKMEESLRETDFAGRWGGEEFVAIMPVDPEATTEDLTHALDRFHQAVQSVNRHREGVPFEPLTLVSAASSSTRIQPSVPRRLSPPPTKTSTRQSKPDETAQSSTQYHRLFRRLPDFRS